jgi:hypothetical protein
VSRAAVVKAVAVVSLFVSLLVAVPTAQQPRVPSARLVSAPRLTLPVQVDTNTPLTWDAVEGVSRLSAIASWGGIPVLLSGASLDGLQVGAPVEYPGAGVWISSFVVDDGGAWYAYYHHEVPAEACGRMDRFIPSIRSLKSVDRGLTWQDLGIVLEAPPDTVACNSNNRYLVGGVGDVSVMLDSGGTDLYLFFSQYSRVPSHQGVGVARLAWADRDAPYGRAMVWNNGAWIPPSLVEGTDPELAPVWSYPPGTPLAPVTRAWHDGNAAADAFWGASVHWNDYVEQYVMLLNRARDEQFNNEGIYASYAPTLDDPAAWSAPRKLRDGGGWYPQVVGLEPGSGTDKRAGRRARFFLTGRSEQYIEFEK